ncbi:MAG TPA: zinc ABC transporter substrate-binding protein [Candidatus Krumholzibacteria bacterium]|nr:zinc ABC transporter substrate-binding protein [Candidatus Krumholzibacteria bacterium]HPD72478.1 zinc ABC transporter substrate-binding protein [Candidatus Krumholzibacteria bacterium]HRY40590.1 zinc ABC transporter substrate-binding protein [Candidatus Krumholzibacteria bacterium]
MSTRCAAVGVLWLVLVAGAPATANQLDVLVTILPHASLVERLGGDAVRVHVLVGPGQTPETFDPAPRELARFSEAVVWFTTGAPIEPLLAPRLETLRPDLLTVPTAEGLAGLAADEHAGHDHGDVDPHVWVSARNTAQQVRAMTAALVRLLPDRADSIGAAEAELLEDLAAIDRELAALLEPVRGRTFFVFHPAFGYLARDYGLRQVAVESGGLSPSPRHLGGVLRAARDQGATTIFVQPQQSDRLVRSIARETGLAVEVLDPLAPDHLANLLRVGQAIRAALEPRR